jgi:hypothetical protein
MQEQIVQFCPPHNTGGRCLYSPIHGAAHVCFCAEYVAILRDWC